MYLFQSMFLIAILVVDFSFSVSMYMKNLLAKFYQFFGGKAMYKINIFVTNSCNAKTLPPMENSPGVCDFCFRPTTIMWILCSIIDFYGAMC